MMCGKRSTVLMCRPTTSRFCKLSVTLWLQRGMWPVILAWARTYAPYAVMPLAGVVGVIGYNIEGWISDKHTPYKESAIERRELRREKEAVEGTADFQVPSTIFGKNVSPGLESK